MIRHAAKGRIPELDGLRGTAILSVLSFHYVSQQGAAAHGTMAALLQRLVVLGWSGVDLFFVLSGFLIGGILMDARESPSYFRTFYARRFFRIIPIYYLWILAYIALIGFAGAKVQALSNSGLRPTLGFSVYAHFLFLQNLGLPVAALAGLAGAWFGHLWSLAVEEQFYFLAPAVVRWTDPRHLPARLCVAIALVPLIRISLLKILHVSPSLVTVLMPCRADALGMGMLAAVLWRHTFSRDWMQRNVGKLYGALVALLVGVAALWMWSPQSSTLGMQTVGFTWLALFYAILLLLALLRSSGPIATVMRIGWLRDLGTVSYCVYIIHIAVNVGLHAVLLRASPRIATPRGATVTVLAAFLTYGIAKLSWISYENPLLRRGRTFKY
jgi:peptidoglycan/LPS O-acetylase OafA/YrhL